jgi:hypothetical protein
MDKVYLVVRYSLDISPNFMEPRGCFRTRAGAEGHKRYLWDRFSIETAVVEYSVLGPEAGFTVCVEPERKP